MGEKEDEGITLAIAIVVGVLCAIIMLIMALWVMWDTDRIIRFQIEKYGHSFGPGLDEDEIDRWME